MRARPLKIRLMDRIRCDVFGRRVIAAAVPRRGMLRKEDLYEFRPTDECQSATGHVHHQSCRNASEILPDAPVCEQPPVLRDAGSSGPCPTGFWTHPVSAAKTGDLQRTHQARRWRELRFRQAEAVPTMVAVILPAGAARLPEMLLPQRPDLPMLPQAVTMERWSRFR